jgi:cysteine desulfurase
MNLIYLDHNATTPIDPEVLEAMLPFLREEYGNPSSAHLLGRRARAAVNYARSQVAELIGALPEEIVFTSGGTEASQIALIGGAEARRAQVSRPLRILSFALEHPATLQPLEALRRRGDQVTLVPPDADGVARIDPFLLPLAGETPPDLVSLMLAHNETGALQPCGRVGAAARSRGSIFHVDAAQAVGKIPVDVRAIGCDFLSIAGHKLYAPKGVGVLYVRTGTDVRAILPGAGQERGLRGGTENVAGIVALGHACALAKGRLAAGEEGRLGGLRERLWAGLSGGIPGISRTSADVESLPNTLHVRFPDVHGNAMLDATPGIAASTGSACHSGIDRPPEAILALGVPVEIALGSVRLSLGHSTNAEAIEAAVSQLIAGWRAAKEGNGHGSER